MKKRVVILIVLGISQLVCYLFLCSLGNLRKHIIACEAGFFTAFLLYLTTLLLLNTKSGSAFLYPQNVHPSHSSGNHLPSLVAILCFSLCYRFIMLFSPPSLSDDIYRYLWEGTLVSHGLNPYEHAPLDSPLKHLCDAKTYLLINHKEFPAIYPPLAQLILGVSTSLFPTITSLKLTFTLFDLFTIVILLFTLKTLQLELNRIIIYAWNPLIIAEFAGSGHLDSAGIFLLMLSLYLFYQGRDFSPTIVLTFSFLCKLLPFIFLPFFIIKRTLTKFGIFILTAFVFYLPFLSTSKNIFHSLLVYSKHWLFNASLYNLFQVIGFSPLHARGVSALTFLSITTLLFIRYYTTYKEKGSASALYQVGFIALGALFLLSPVLHPWYLCWIIPFLVIQPNRAWILFSGLLFLSYWVLKGYEETGIWKENTLIKLVEYIPFYTLLLYEGVRRRRPRFKLIRTFDLSRDTLVT